MTTHQMELDHKIQFSSKHVPFIMVLLTARYPVYVMGRLDLMQDMRVRLCRWYNVSFHWILQEVSLSDDKIIVMISRDKPLISVDCWINPSDCFLTIASRNKFDFESITQIRSYFDSLPLASTINTNHTMISRIQMFRKKLRNRSGIYECLDDTLIAKNNCAAAAALIQACVEFSNGTLDIVSCGYDKTHISVCLARFLATLNPGVNYYNTSMSTVTECVDRLEQNSKPMMLFRMNFSTSININEVCVCLCEHMTITGAIVILLLDCTYASMKQVMESVMSPLPCIVMTNFVESNKSIGSSIIANSQSIARQIMGISERHLTLFDNSATCCRVLKMIDVIKTNHSTERGPQRPRSLTF